MTTLDFQYSAPGAPGGSLRLFRLASEFIADVSFERGPWRPLFDLWAQARGLTAGETRGVLRVLVYRRGRGRR